MNEEYLFSYGTLQYERVQLATFGRILVGKKDRLPGFCKEKVQIADSDVIAKSGESVHSIVKRSGKMEDAVDGIVFCVSMEDLRQADLYEVADYKREKFRLASGLEAWVYVAV